MTDILVDKLRVDGFRGLKDFQMNLSKVTVLTGVNNVGKTTVLKALQLAFGSRSQLVVEDLHQENGERSNKILVDYRIVSVDESGSRQAQFDEAWEIVFQADSIRQDETEGFAYVPVRCEFVYNLIKGGFDTSMRLLPSWEVEGKDWREIPSGKIFRGVQDNLPFHYIEAQRDVMDDIRSRSSYIGKVLSDVKYEPEKAREIERKINELNRDTIDGSDVLTRLEDTLGGIDSALGSRTSKVSIAPFAAKLRDLNKNLSIRYGTSEDSFTMDYHGMGTRSWTSMMTFAAFVKLREIMLEDGNVYFPFIAIEEPEAHLHPNAQKQLYSQLAALPGQKIISTHSPYVASCAKLEELRGMYKLEAKVLCGELPIKEWCDEDRRKIAMSVIRSHGEILFASMIILGEGETEEQALPIFGEKYFGSSLGNAGIEVLGVNGCGRYKPFVQLAKSFNIPWFIFSDGEDKTIKALKKMLNEVYAGAVALEDCIDKSVFVINNQGDFEQMLVDDGYASVIEPVLSSYVGVGGVAGYISRNDGKPNGRRKTDKPRCSTCGQEIYEDLIKDYSGEDGYKRALVDIMSNNKTQIAPAVAYAIVESVNPIPPLVKKLFDNIKAQLYGE